MVRRRRPAPSSAIPAHLLPGSSLQLASIDEWCRQRLSFMSEVGRDGLLALGTRPVDIWEPVPRIPPMPFDGSDVRASEPVQYRSPFRSCFVLGYQACSQKVSDLLKLLLRVRR